jgi:hypothetical protein
MGYQRQAGDNLSDGGYVKLPGFYHLIVTQVDDPVTKKDGSLWTGKAFRVHFEVLGGNVAGQDKKTVNVAYNEPLPSHSDGGEFCGRLIDRFALAVGLIGPADKQKPYVVDAPIVGRQVIANLECSTDRDGNATGFMDIAGRGLEIYHIDDPTVSAIPKNAGAMKLIPAAFRRAAKRDATAMASGTPAVTPTTNGSAASVANGSAVNAANL